MELVPAPASAMEGTVCPCLMASLIVDDITKVSQTVTIFTLLAALSYPLMSIIVSQASVAADQGCFFASGVLHPISRPVSKGGITPMDFVRRFCYNDLVHCLSPLQG
jgi:hypothetical protein